MPGASSKPNKTIGKVSKMKATKSQQELHDIAVQKIAEMQFTFPNGEFTPAVFHPTWVTCTNVPKKQMPVPHHWMEDLYPDIVIVDTARCNIPRIIAEVETQDDLTFEKAVQSKWKPDLDECSILYLFVPEGTARDAAGMLLDYRLCFPTAIYTYGFDEAGNVRITPV